MPQAFIRVFVFVAAVLVSGAASAADIKVLISAGFFKVYSELGPAFEKSTGHKLVTTRGPSVGDSPEAIPARLARGEEADVRQIRAAAAVGIGDGLGLQQCLA